MLRSLGWLIALLLCGSVGAEPYAAPFPVASTKKGLQVQMVDDALALGIKHAALNFNLAQLIDPRGDPNHPSIQFDGKTYHFQPAYLDHLDRQVKALSDQGVVVSLILLNYTSSDPAVRQLLQHPKYDPACPNHISAFNTQTPEGRAWWSASVEFLARRWSGPDGSHGRVWNWIVGNEVNSHWFWANQGRTEMKPFVDDYLRTVRLAHEAIRRHSLHARVYVSLEHHWNIRIPGSDERQAFPARAFLDYFALRARQSGDFDWHVAFHPYPENLFEPRSWRDQSATADWRTTPRITFRNLDQLPAYLDQPELRYNGQRRHVILSEQGFHTPDGPDGELIQAASFCYAWNQVARLEGVDSFILHRHVDYRDEGGLRLGLWTRKTDSVATPDRKKKIYEVFRLADTPDWRTAFEFALPIIGVKNWP